MHLILHIAPREAWEEARQNGYYRAPSLASEGFIHCSTPKQVIRVANTFYRGQSDLLLLYINADHVGAPVRYEPPAEQPDSDERFPHIYGPLHLDAVVQVAPLPIGPDGLFQMPPG